MTVRYSQEVEALMYLARRQAQLFGYRKVDVPSLLMALSLGGNSIEARALGDAGFSDRKIRDQVRRLWGRRQSTNQSVSRLSPEVREVLQMASFRALRAGRPTIEPHHLLNAAINSDTGKSFLGGPAVVQIIREAVQLRTTGVIAWSHVLLVSA